MTTLQEFRCEVCGLIATNPTRWFVIRGGDSDLTVFRWNSETVNAGGARHYCGEGHAQVYLSRWFDSVCMPQKPTFNQGASGKKGLYASNQLRTYLLSQWIVRCQARSAATLLYRSGVASQLKPCTAPG